MTSISYTETIQTYGIRVPVVAPIINDRMRGVIESGRYERNEVRLLERIVTPDDRVLELGAGVGVVSTAAARKIGADRVTTIEANPDLIPLIRETHRLNAVEGIRLIHGVGLSAPEVPELPFYLRENFWASSLDWRRQDRRATGLRTVSVPTIDLNSLMAEVAPTILVMDIEGGELELLDALDLRSVRAVIMEFHPRVYGQAGVSRIFDNLRIAGLAYDPMQSRGGTVVVFTRFAATATSKTRVCAVTCMKDEGPFILEWVAYHRAIGMTDFLIFTNDCSDGTGPLLDALDRRGIVRHLPNPSGVLNSPRHQPIAVQYAKQHKEAAGADWVISMDVDEFLNIHVGDGRLDDLFAAMPEARVISLSHLDFGCDGIEVYEDQFVTRQMARCQSPDPVERDRRGIKTLVHRDAPANRLSNHRPFFQNPEEALPVWVDGSGRAMAPRVVEGEHKGIDARGAYDLAQINHYPVRSMETFLVKSIKGDVVAVDKFAGIDYFDKRDAAVAVDTSILRHLDAAGAEFDALLADPEIRELHLKAVAHHARTIADLRKAPDRKTLLGEMKRRHASRVSAD